MKRRDFLLGTSLVATGLMAQKYVDLDKLAVAAGDVQRGEMRYRRLGSTGEEISILGVGGSHIGKQDDPQESIRIIQTAIDRGITFMDNSWDYNGGESEMRMGQALQNGYRDKVFLMTKFDGRTREAAARQIDESLARLKTDHVDLLMLHEVIRMDDAERFFAKGGGVEAALAARKAGKTRYLGFTGHKDPQIHLHMLDMAVRHDFHLDAVLIPLNVLDAHYKSFEHQVLPRLVSQNIGVLSMKPLGGGFIMKTKAVSATECLHYAMTVCPGTVITGMDSMQTLDQATEAVRSFKPLSQAQMAAILERTVRFAAGGQHELFKTSDYFDSTAQHPEWMG